MDADPETPKPSQQIWDQCEMALLLAEMVANPKNLILLHDLAGTQYPGGALTLSDGQLTKRQCKCSDLSLAK
jgi:hypothetical protein